MEVCWHRRKGRNAFLVRVEAFPLARSLQERYVPVKKGFKSVNEYVTITKVILVRRETYETH